jgi:hypothetical protein
MLSAEKHQQKIFLRFKLKSWILQSILEPVDVADKKSVFEESLVFGRDPTL